MTLLGTALFSQLTLALPTFDPFADATASGGTSYAVGSTLTNQFNPALFIAWYSRGGSFGSTTPLIVSGNLSYPGLPASTGNSASFAPALSTSACQDLNLPSGGQPNMVFCSFLLKITDLSVVPTTPTNNPFAAFGDDPAQIPNQIGRLGCRLLTKKVGSGFVLGTSKSATVSDFVYEPDGNAHAAGDVVFVVQGYQREASVQTNVYLWINPSAASFGSSTPPAPTVTALTGNTALNNNGARSFALMCQFATAPSGVIDDIRIATDWAAVTGGPGIYVQPTNRTSNAGTTATFSVAAFGGSPLGYQWQKDGLDLTNGGRISGATTATLSVSSALQADAAGYSVVVSNSYSAVTSTVATLTVNDPFITTQPTNRTVAFGATAVLHVAAAGTPTLTYQWYKDASPLSDGGPDFRLPDAHADDQRFHERRRWRVQRHGLQWHRWQCDQQQRATASDRPFDPDAAGKRHQRLRDDCCFPGNARGHRAVFVSVAQNRVRRFERWRKYFGQPFQRVDDHGRGLSRRRNLLGDG